MDTRSTGKTKKRSSRVSTVTPNIQASFLGAVCSILCCIWATLFKDIVYIYCLTATCLEIALLDIDLDPSVYAQGVAAKSRH